MNRLELSCSALLLAQGSYPNKIQHSDHLMITQTLEGIRVFTHPKLIHNAMRITVIELLRNTPISQNAFREQYQ
jgi:hypothetical protein